MKAIFYNFSKRLNSTKQPSGGTELDVVLKQPTSIHNPTLRIKAPTFNYNYCYIPTFSTYYWLSGDTRSITNDTWEADFKTDVLATHKAAIQSANCFVLYDTTANRDIVDNRLAVDTLVTMSSNAILFRSDLIQALTPIVTIIGKDNIGAYVVPYGNLGRLLPDFGDVYDSFLSEDNPFGAYKALITGLSKTGGGAAEYIRDVKALPFSVAGDTLISPLMIGNYELPIGGRRIDNRINKQSVKLNIPWQFHDWRDTNPYTEVVLYIPFVGNISLPTSQLVGYSSITVVSSLDYLSGDIAIVVHVGDEGGTVIGTYGANTAVSILFGESGVSASKIANSVIQGVGAVASGNVLGLVGAGLEAIHSVGTSVGGISSAAGVGLDNYVRVYTVCHATNVEPSSVSAVMGTPAYAAKSLGSLSGYVQTLNASVSIDAPADEISAVNSYLDGGIYLE